MPTGKNRVNIQIPVYLWADLLLNGIKGGYPCDIKAVYNVGSNYLNQQGNSNKAAKALANLDLMITHDHFLTSTARYADIVLPASMFPERNDILLPWAGHGRYIIFQSKVVDPPPEVKTDLKIFTEISEKFGFSQQYNSYSEEEWLKLFCEKLKIQDYEEFKRRGITLSPYKSDIPFKLQIKKRKNFSTPSGKIELYSKRLARLHNMEIPPLPTYLPSWEGAGDALSNTFPLQLLSPKNASRIHSSLTHSSVSVKGYNRIWINPKDANTRGLSQGDIVKIFNKRGEVLAEAYITEKIIKGVVSLDEGAWYTPNETGIDSGGCPNTLTSDKPTPLAKAAITHTTLVQITRYQTS